MSKYAWFYRQLYASEKDLRRQQGDCRPLVGSTTSDQDDCWPLGGSTTSDRDDCWPLGGSTTSDQGQVQPLERGAQLTLLTDIGR